MPSLSRGTSAKLEGTLGVFVDYSGLELSSPAIKPYIALDHHRHIPPLHEKLHHPLTVPRHRSPPRLRIRVLFEAAYLLPVELEINLTQFALGCPQDWVPFGSENNGCGAFRESLPENFN
jgi:hypothetical protein